MEKINWSGVWGIIVRHLFIWKKDLDRLVDAFWWATTDLIFWGLTSNYVKNLSFIPEITTLFVGGIIFWTTISNSQREINMPLLEDAWNRNLLNIFTTPIGLLEFVLASLILGLIKLTMTVSFLSLIAFLFYKYNIFQQGWLLLPSFINLVLMGWWFGFIIEGLILRYGYKIQAFAWAFIFVAYPFSAVLYPVSILPAWAQMISKIIPASYVFENMRLILFENRYSPQYLLTAFVLNLIYIVLSLIFLQKMYRNCLINGRLIKLN